MGNPHTVRGLGMDEDDIPLSLMNLCPVYNSQYCLTMPYIQLSKRSTILDTCTLFCDTVIKKIIIVIIYIIIYINIFEWLRHITISIYTTVFINFTKTFAKFWEMIPSSVCGTHIIFCGHWTSLWLVKTKVLTFIWCPYTLSYPQWTSLPLW